jgi:hypothetical protein
LAGLVVLSGCGDEETKRASDQAYFPLQTGFYQVYTVEENVYQELDPPVFNTYELKMEVVDSFANQEGGFTYVIYRSTRETENDPWQFLEAWSARTSAQQAVLTEGNISYVQIAFPAFTNQEWNANSLNSMPADSYTIESAGSSYQLNEQNYNDALVISQHQQVNELIRDEREEVYARNVGLIYKKRIVLNYCDQDPPPPSPPCFGQEIIKDGVEYWQVLKEYGQN